MRVLSLFLGTQLWMALPAWAEGISYRYFEAGYANTDIGVADGDGGYIGASWLFNEHWILFGRYGESDLSANSGPAEADYQFIRAGFGYRSLFLQQPNTEWYGLISYNRIDLTVFEDEPESGEDFELGLNYRWRPQLVLNVAARYFYSNIDATDLLAGEAGFVVGADYEFSNSLGLNLAYEDIDRFGEWRLALRKYW